ncbi:chemotaxis protein CheB [Nocardioides aequoreus]|uniref:chemotaxis protein CheB n=1 Tax=Nocardioides aequoreus TaxID=397278 RepID=UPI00068A46C6|nr:chemotaxis protein CheB [Nocardioides aequoreus]
MTAAVRVLVAERPPPHGGSLREALERRGLEVVATAQGARDLLAATARRRPAVVVARADLPGSDGPAWVRRLREAGSVTRVLVVGSPDDVRRGVRRTALAAGADDWLTAVPGADHELVRRVLALAPPPPAAPTAAAALALPSPLPPLRPARAVTGPPVRLLVVAGSTGGPEALLDLLPALAPLSVPVAVVQHLPEHHVGRLVARLQRACPFPVVEAAHDAALLPGVVHLAPAGRHLEVTGSRGRYRSRLGLRAPEHHARPAADVLFRTAASAAGSGVLAVVLTGMGHDGVRGAAAVVASGGRVLAQGEACSVVWGMPGAVVAAGLATEVVPLRSMPLAVRTRMPLPARARASG